MWILVVEDEQQLAEALRKGLENHGHSVVTVTEGREGLVAAQMHGFDAIVLDILLPGIDGLEVARRLRTGGNKTPILFLTARDSVADVVKGLDLGADDYMTKPFAFQELLARLRNISRHGPAQQNEQLTVSDLVLNTATHEVKRADRKINLTPTEYRLLELLMRRSDRVVPRSVILEAIWGFDRQVDRSTLDVFVRSLRQKVDLEHEWKLIHTIRGFGYSLRGPEE